MTSMKDKDNYIKRLNQKLDAAIDGQQDITPRAVLEQLALGLRLDQVFAALPGLKAGVLHAIVACAAVSTLEQVSASNSFEREEP